MMKETLLSVLCMAFMQTLLGQTHWIPATGFQNNMTMSAVLFVNGEEQALDYVEIGAFCGEECRGAGLPLLVGGQRVYFLAILGNVNDVIMFRLWDHHTDTELEYECQTTCSFVVDGILGEYPDWYQIHFTAPEPPPVGFHFVTDGDWSEVSNWNGHVLPGTGDEAFIEANCTLNMNADVASLTVTGGKVLTLQAGSMLTVTEALANEEPADLIVADGAQLVAPGSVNGTMLKSIPDSDGSNHWSLITSPVDDISPEDVTDMLSNEYSLYYFDQTNELGWCNYAEAPFNLSSGRGYLYANSEDVILAFAGSLCGHAGMLHLDYDAAAEFKGWNLVGNPFSYNAYIADGRPYYVMNDNGNEVIASAGGAIAPLQGIFVVTTNADGEDIQLIPTATEAIGQIVLNVVDDRAVAIDRAIVRFDDCGRLGKFMLDESNTKIYIPWNGSSYAVVNSDLENDIPVSFKPKESGNYTLSIDINNVELDYLHLVDRVTGVDIDLLSNPEYGFVVTGHEPESRFTLVFEPTIGMEEHGRKNFCFVKRGNLCFTADAEGASFSLIDMAGRIVRQGTLKNNSISLSSLSEGLYIVRLVDGKDVKTQKILVK